MLVKCPKCRTLSRVHVAAGEPRVTNYFCSTCQKIVLLDLLRDEVKSTSSADSVEKPEHKKKILVTDDEPPICELAGELLTSAGYDVLTARDGEEALRLVYDEHPDLILLDLILPKMTGFHVLQEIRKDPRIRNTPVLILSVLASGGHTDPSTHDLDVAGFIDKMEFVTTLVSRVQEYLHKKPHVAA